MEPWDRLKVPDQGFRTTLPLDYLGNAMGLRLQLRVY